MYVNELRGHQEWLERPYQDMVEDSDRFVEWADEEDCYLDDPTSFKEAEIAYEDYLEGLAEDWALSQYESHVDRMIDEAYEREWEYS